MNISKEFERKLKEKGLYDDFVYEVLSEQRFKSDNDNIRKKKKNRRFKRQLNEMKNTIKKLKQKAAKMVKYKKNDKLDKKFQQMSEEMERKTYLVKVDYTYYPTYISRYGNNHTWIAPNDEESVNFTVTTHSITKHYVQQLVEDRLESMKQVYVYYTLVSIDDYNYLKKQDIIKNATYNNKKERMKGVHMNFETINDVKFDKTGYCVYDALSSIKRAPKIFKNKQKLLNYF